MQRAALLLLVLLAWVLPAHAQQPAAAPRPERLYLNPSALLGGSRVVALGGAYVGLAEGAAGFPTNLAALAHRDSQLERDWDAGFTLSWLDLTLSSPLRRDIDNDGLSDEAPASRQLLGGVLLQYRHLGLGFFMRNGTVAYCATAACAPGDHIRVSLSTTALAGAVAFGRDDFLLAFGLYSAEARFAHLGQTWRYGNTGIAFDLLYRPLGRPYRIGVALRPEVVARWLAEEGQAPSLAGRQLFSAVVAPGVLSLGASWRLGEGAQRYNRLSPAARRQLAQGRHAAELPPEEEAGLPTGRWLVSAQLDVIGGVENARPVRSFTALAPEVPVGTSLALQPRVGVEHETWPGRLRTRAGAFIEPSPFAERLPRPHLTGGLEVHLFRYWEDWSLSASFDVAHRYSNLGISVGFWR